MTPCLQHMNKIFIHSFMPSLVPDSRNRVLHKSLSPCPMLYITDEKIQSLQSVLPNMVALGLHSKFSVPASTPHNFRGTQLNISSIVLSAFSWLFHWWQSTLFHPMGCTIPEHHLHLCLVRGQNIQALKSNVGSCY